MRVLVCGGRTFGEMPDVSGLTPEQVRAVERRAKEERALVYRTLSALRPKPTLVIEGGADGADRIAERWCHSTGTPFMCFPANWEQWGPAAGPMRNAMMITQGKPELVVAFPGGRGTANMVRKAKSARIRVREVTLTVGEAIEEAV